MCSKYGCLISDKRMADCPCVSVRVEETRLCSCGETLYYNSRSQFNIETKTIKLDCGCGLSTVFELSDSYCEDCGKCRCCNGMLQMNMASTDIEVLPCESCGDGAILNEEDTKCVEKWREDAKNPMFFMTSSNSC
jgi:hypothetical protein